MYVCMYVYIYIYIYIYVYVCMCVCVYIYIYIYIDIYIYLCFWGGGCRLLQYSACTPNRHTNIVGFRGFDSIIILIKRGGVSRAIADCPEKV